MMTFSSHDDCRALSSMFQGRLCETLTGRPGRIVEAEQSIYAIGDAALNVYFLRRGLVKLTALSADGKEIILSVHKAGEIFGEFCLCEGRRAEMAVAMEQSDVVQIKFEELLERLGENRDAMQNFLISVCQRLARAHQIICEFSFDNVPKRLGKVLLRLSDEFGREVDGRVELSHYITQEELSQMVSARREVVSSALSRLRQQGLIDYSRKGKLSVKREALVAYIGEADNSAAPSRPTAVTRTAD